MGHRNADAAGREARTLTDDLLRLPPPERREWYRKLDARDMRVVVSNCRHQLGSPYGLWQDDPVGFVQDVCGDTTWAKQEQVLESVRDHVRTAVPATHSPGKTFTGGRLVCWFVAVNPLGTAVAITTAPKLRQVRNIMWPGIRRAHAAGRLPGIVQTTQWKIDGEVVAYGFSSADYDEDAVQGIHAPKVLFVVDEAGGISHTLGQSYAAILSQPMPRLLIIGNAPTDEEGTWFEEQAERSEEHVHTVRIAAKDTPNFTGERTGRCTTCPPQVPPHRVAMHLTSVEWVEESIAEFGEESAFVQARVHARFPRSLSQKVMPLDWVEAAADDEQEPAAGAWVRLGADIASEGGDEFVIARTVGYAAQIVHRSSGAANADPVNLAGQIVQATRDACEIRQQLGEERLVHVKIDASGMGWGVAGLVKRQVEEQGLPAKVLPVRGEDRPNDETQFRNARSELWWNTRRLVKPETDPRTGAVVQPGRLKLANAPTRLIAQLSAPKYATDSAGRIVVEKKSQTKKRVQSSPDLADAVNLSLYEPPGGGDASVDRPAPVAIPTRPPAASTFAGVIPLRPPQR